MYKLGAFPLRLDVACVSLGSTLFYTDFDTIQNLTQTSILKACLLLIIA